MFADVSGSTQLYERLGDTQAHECISESLQRIVRHVKQNRGRLIETIGDEAMVTFADPHDAIQAACSIQRQFAVEPVSGGQRVKVRIGFHFGPIEYDATQHPFGDTVNVAARVVALCEAGRIIATRESLSRINGAGDFTLRAYQRTRVKGKSEPLVTDEIVWDNEDSTSLFNATQNTLVKAPGPMMNLAYRDQLIALGTDRLSFVIGRGPESDLVIDNALASRAHAKLEFRWGEVYLVDHSTNGTYLRLGDSRRETHGTASVRLHRRELLLTGKGEIGIGTPVENAGDTCLIRFEIY